MKKRWGMRIVRVWYGRPETTEWYVPEYDYYGEVWAGTREEAEAMAAAANSVVVLAQNEADRTHKAMPLPRRWWRS